MKTTLLLITIISLMGCTNAKTDNQNAAKGDSLVNEVTETTEEPQTNKSPKSSLTLTAIEAAILAREVNMTSEDGEPIRELSDEDAAAISRAMEKANKEGIEMGIWGFIGGSHAELDMNGLTGTYSYRLDNDEIKRRLEFESWDLTTGRLLLRAYELKGDKYIGQFDGTLEISNVAYDDNEDGEYTVINYDGIFTNYKGAKTDFRLWFD